jgi:hypothetical protein
MLDIILGVVINCGFAFLTQSRKGAKKNPLNLCHFASLR